MKFLFFLIFIIPQFISIKAQSIQELNLTEFQSLVSEVKENRVISFWASWCTPCMEELPYFSKLKKENPYMEVVLINLDFKKDVDTKVKPIISKKDYINCKVVRVSNLNPDDWIAATDMDWDGAIPATISFAGSKKQFMSGKFSTYSDLKKFVHN